LIIYAGGFFPVGHPGDFPRVWAQQPVCQSPLNSSHCLDHPSLNLLLLLPRQRIVSHISRANQSCQVISGNRSLHPSHCCGVLSLGKVQCRRQTDTSGQSQTDAGTVAKIAERGHLNSNQVSHKGLDFCPPNSSKCST